MNYVYQRGGWIGEKPNWDTSVPIDSKTDFVQEMHTVGVKNMDEFSRRMATFMRHEIGEGGEEEAEEEDEDDFVNVDRPWREME